MNLSPEEGLLKLKHLMSTFIINSSNLDYFVFSIFFSLVNLDHLSHPEYCDAYSQIKS